MNCFDRRLVSTPGFKAEWKQEFVLHTCNPSILRVACWMGFVLSTYIVVTKYFECRTQTECWAKGNRLWFLAPYAPDAVFIVGTFTIATMISISSYRKKLMHYYEGLCSWFVVCLYTTTVFPSFMLEIRRSRFQQPGYVHWKIEHSGVWPVRVCNDTDPVLSWAKNYDQLSVGCSNSLLDGNVFGTMIRAVALSLLLLALLVSAFLVIGTSVSVFAAAAGVQLACGLSAAYFCLLCDQDAREDFVVLKVRDVGEDVIDTVV